MFLKSQALVVLVTLVIKCGYCISDEIIFDLEDHGGKCKTPNNREGLCKKFYKCSSLYSLSQDNSFRNDPLVKDHIDKSFCFVDKYNTSFVCCEKDAEICTTIENKPGTCIPLDRCGPIKQLFSKRTFQDDQKRNFYLQSSSCKPNQNDKKSRVCCPLVHTSLSEDVLDIFSKSDVPSTEKPRVISKNLSPLDALIEEIFGPTTTVPNKKDMLPEPGEEVGQCGTNGIANRIFGGRETDLYEYPWMALLHYEKDASPDKFRCAGTVINKRYILTAAHCLAFEKALKLGKVNMVRLGEWDTTNKTDCIRREDGIEECAPSPIDIRPEEIISHPDFTLKSIHHDIALIRLSKEINFAETLESVKPICLPVDDDEIPADQQFSVAGWGITETGEESPRKKSLDKLPLYDKKKCQDYIRRARNRVIGSGQICAGGILNEDACTGDSGGPLMSTKIIPGRGRFYFETGIISYGIGCGGEDLPGIYTNVAHYMDWILENMKPF